MNASFGNHLRVRVDGWENLSERQARTTSIRYQRRFMSFLIQNANHVLTVYRMTSG